MATKTAKARMLIGWLLICLILCLLWTNYNLARELEEVKQDMADERLKFYELEGLYHGLILDRLPSREGAR